MPAYKAPVEDALFLLNDVFHMERVANRGLICLVINRSVGGDQFGGNQRQGS